MTHMSQKNQIIGLVGWLVISFIAAGIGAAASVQASSFYAELVRPGWAPPSAVFARCGQSCMRLWVLPRGLSGVPKVSVPLAHH